MTEPGFDSQRPDLPDGMLASNVADQSAINQFVPEMASQRQIVGHLLEIQSHLRAAERNLRVLTNEVHVTRSQATMSAPFAGWRKRIGRFSQLRQEVATDLCRLTDILVDQLEDLDTDREELERERKELERLQPPVLETPAPSPAPPGVSTTDTIGGIGCVVMSSIVGIVFLIRLMMTALYAGFP